MSKQVQYRRGNTVENDAFVGALAEITVDTTELTLRVHDGVTAGGALIINANSAATLANKTLDGVTFSGTVTGNLIPSANITYDLGNSTNYWNNLYLAGNTIYLGSLQLRAIDGNTFGVFSDDGAVDAGISVANIGQGSSVLGIHGANGNIFMSVDGVANVMQVSATGVTVQGNIDTTGNISAQFVLGNGSQLTGISTDTNRIFNGASEILIPSSNSNVLISIDSTANIVEISALGIETTGNIQAANGVFTDISGTLTTASQPNITAVGNLTAVTVLGNVDAGNVTAAQDLVALGNISGSYILGNGSQLTGIDATSIQNGTSNVRTFLDADVTVSAAGTANVLTVTSTGASVSGTFTATGNVSGDYILGNGAYLSGLNLSFGVDALSFTGDGSTVAFTIFDGYAANTVMVFENGVAQAPDTDYTVSGNVVTFSQAPGSGVSIAMRLLNGSSIGGGGGNVDLSAVAQDIIPAANLTYDLGNTTNRWNDIWLANSTIYLGEATISASGAELMLPAQVAIGNATIDGSSGGIVLPANSTVGGATVATPRIASIDYPGDDTAADPAGGQTIGIVGSGFQAAASVILDGVTVGVVTFVSSTRLEIITPARAAGSYVLYVVNPDGGTGIFVPGVQYSGVPAWSSPAAGSLGAVYETQNISNTFVATSDSAVTYSLQSGTLPAGSTLNANTGVLSGTANLTAGNPITYNFTIRATDAELQDTDRAFSFTIDPDVVTWSSPTNGSTVTVEANVASTTTLSATSAVGSGITYSANALPTGLTVSGNTVTGTATVAGNTSVALTATANTTTRSATITVNFVVSLASDPYFNQTVLLLHGDGTNGAQNNTFLDSSTNNFTITRNPATGPNAPTQGTFSPFSLAAGEWSNYFDGNGDYLSISSSASPSGTEDFCVEFWYTPGIKPSNYPCVFSLNTTYNVTTTLSIYDRYDAYITKFSVFGCGINGMASTTTVTPGVTYHIAVTRNLSGGVYTLRLFVNGVLETSQTGASGSLSPNSCFIGRADTASLALSYLNGYVSNFRIVRGSSVYTSNFTPTGPLTAIANTSLLTCQSNRFIDNSTNNFTITRNGDVRVTPFSPFAPTAAYSAGTNGGSGYFDGTGDFVSIGDNVAIQLGSSNFTIEFWAYFNVLSGTTWIVGKGDAGTAAGSMISWPAVGSANWSFYYGSSSLDVARPTYTVGQWSHIAVVRSGATITTYLNGVVAGTGNLPLSTTSLNTGGANPLRIASYSTGATNCYVSDFRLVKGTAVYTGAFTPPIAPISTSGSASEAAYSSTTNVNTTFASSETSLLLNFTNAGIFDNTGKNNLETVGNAQIDTAVKKYGTGSMEFDGTDDRIFTPSSVDLIMGTGDFTIEGWFYANSLSNKGIFQISATAGGLQANATTNIAFALQTNGYTVYAASVGTTITAVVPVVNVWTYFAVVRSSGVTRLYINGSQAGSNITDTTNYAGGNLVVGGYYSTSFLFNGYIDDLRITKGVARYTTNFTPPTSAFPDY